MAKWDQLPNEVFEAIIDALLKDENLDQAKWIMVSKQWYDQ